MTESASGPRVPGTTLLKIARLLFSDRLVSAVIEPTIADLQCEVAEAGSSRAKRLRAHWRGYRAFWTMILIGPFSSWIAPARNAGAVAFPDAMARLAIGSTFLTLLAVVSPVVGALVAVVTAAGALFAIGIHAWYQRHPSDVSTPTERRWRSPQINFSSTEVPDNSGGLLFVVGSVFVLAFGLPPVFWFVLAGTVAGCGVARGLAAWHTHHPQRGVPENRIVWR